MPFDNYLWWCKDELDVFSILKELGDEWYFLLQMTYQQMKCNESKSDYVTLLCLQFPHCQYCLQILFLEITIPFDISAVSINQ